MTNQVAASMIAALPTVQTTDLADNGVTTAKIADANVTTAKVADANITAAKLDGAQTGTAPIYGCRAWVRFAGNGTVSTNQTIQASGNVASVFKNATGDYTINFTTAMPDANYIAVCNAQFAASGGHQAGDNVFLIMANQTQTASALRVNTQAGNVNSGTDVVVGMVAVFR